MITLENLDRGVSLRELQRLWEDHGGTVVHRRRTGEARFVAADGRTRSGLFSVRNKDAPLKLVSFVRRVLSQG